MAITRTAKGTVTAGIDFDPGDNSITLSSVTLTAGSTLVVMVARTKSNVQPTSVVWGSTPLTLVRQVAFGTNRAGGIWVATNVPGGTASITATWATVPLALYVMGLMAVQLETTQIPAHDQTQTTSGDSTTASGTLGATQFANEYLQSFVFRTGLNVGADAVGTWGDGFTAGQNDGASLGSAFDLRIAEGFEHVTATGVYSASLVFASRPWSMVLVSFVDSQQPSGIRLGGYTSYDLELTDPDIGALVNPEVEAAIRRGDQRYTRGR